jgi:hypothetical protein
MERQYFEYFAPRDHVPPAPMEWPASNIEDRLMGVFIHHDFKDIDHILFAELDRVLRFGRDRCSLLCGDLRLSEDCGQPERRPSGL